MNKFVKPIMNDNSDSNESLPWTDERFVPEMYGNNALEHLHRYVMARELAVGKTVLDIACGEGYGSAMIAQVARHVIGVDISHDVVKHAAHRYGRSNLEFRTGSCAEIPIADNSIDLVVSFETIEHHDQHETMMAEIKRVLRPDGVFIISSPEKYEYSIAPNYSNPFHVKELHRHEFERLMAINFKCVAMFGQRVVYGSGILREGFPETIVTYDACIDSPRPNSGMRRPIYLIAVASDATLPPTASSFFDQPVSESEVTRNWLSVVAERDEQISSLNRRVRLSDLRLRLAKADGFSTRDYSTWIYQYDTLTDKTRAKMRQIADEFTHKPLISVIMPCYNPKPEWLKEAIESVRRQIYPHWELCIADDASTDPAIRPMLEDYSHRDARIRVVFRESNGHVSAASNSALALATGEYVALLDHDDLLAEQALFWVAEAVNQHPNAGLIYSDEDKINESGQRFGPYFKCDWNYDLFLSQNMIAHLGVYKAELLRKIDGFREGLEGAQDYDLALRCIEQLKASQIIHVPRVLYHWRTHQASAAMPDQAQPYALVAAQRTLNEHLARKGISAQAELHPDCNFYRVRYALPKPAPLVTLIIPTRNGLHLIRQCLSSILKKTDYPNYEILIIDNGSDDPQTLRYFDIIKSDPRFCILRDDRPFNYSAINNRAVQAARGDLVGLINNDIEVINSEWLTEMVSIALQPGVGAVGARLWYPDNTLQHGGVILGLGRVAGHSHKHLPKGHPGHMGRAMLQQSFSAVTAACLVVRRSIFLEVGGLEEENLKVAFNDVDFCLRVRKAGYRNVWTPFAEAYHHESATRYEDTSEKRARLAGEARYLQKRWGSLLLNDPAYSPNLTLDHVDFSYAWPPRVAPLEDLEC